MSYCLIILTTLGVRYNHRVVCSVLHVPNPLQAFSREDIRKNHAIILVLIADEPISLLRLRHVQNNGVFPMVVLWKRKSYLSVRFLLATRASVFFRRAVISKSDLDSDFNLDFDLDLGSELRNDRYDR